MDCREPAGFKIQEGLGSLVSRNYDSYQGIAKDQTQPFLGLKTDPTLSLSPVLKQISTLSSYLYAYPGIHRVTRQI